MLCTAHRDTLFDWGDEEIRLTVSSSIPPPPLPSDESKKKKKAAHKNREAKSVEKEASQRIESLKRQQQPRSLSAAQSRQQRLHALPPITIPSRAPSPVRHLPNALNSVSAGFPAWNTIPAGSISPRQYLSLFSSSPHVSPRFNPYSGQAALLMHLLTPPSSPRARMYS